MTHLSERAFTDVVEAWFRAEYGDSQVEREVYQPGPYWFVDLVVDTGPVNLFVEVENDAASIRDGVGQALGYAASQPHSVPLLVVPMGHVEMPDVQRLRASQALVIRGFDVEMGEWA